MLTKLNETEIKLKARHAFFDAVEAISQIAECHFPHFETENWDAETSLKFSAEINTLKLRFAKGDSI